MPNFEELAQRLQDAGEASFRRRQAASSLAKLGDKRAVEPLVKTLSDSDKYVRQAATEALGVLNDPEAIGPLANLLTDEDSEVQRRAATALGEIGGSSALSALKGVGEGYSWGVQRAIEKAVEKIGRKISPKEEPAPRATGASADSPRTSPGPAPQEKTLPTQRSAPIVIPKALIQEATEGTQITYTKSKGGLRYDLDVPLPGGRHQIVRVSFEHKDTDGSTLVTMSSLCAPANPKFYERALKMNVRLSYGAVAIAKVRGSNYFVFVDTQLARTADALEIKKSIMTLAERADTIEKQLTGHDVT